MNTNSTGFRERCRVRGIESASLIVLFAGALGVSNIVHADFKGRMTWISQGATTAYVDSPGTACRVVAGDMAKSVGVPVTLKNYEITNGGKEVDCNFKVADPGYSDPYTWSPGGKYELVCPANSYGSSNGPDLCQCLSDFTERYGQCIANDKLSTEPVDAKNAGGGSGCNLVGNPINPGTGAKFLTEQDYSGAASSPLPLILERNYNSRSDSRFQDVGFGVGWRHNYSAKVIAGVVDGALVAIVLRSDGKTIEFREVSGVMKADGDIRDTLVVTRAAGTITGFTLTENESQNVESYDGAGRLTKVRTASGWAQTLSYSTSSTPVATAAHAGLLIEVADQSGRKLLFKYNSADQISEVVDPAGKSILYVYDDLANLISVTYQDAKKRAYVYNEAANTANTDLPNSLTGITDEMSRRYATYKYAADGRAVQTEHGTGALKYQVTYNVDGSAKVVDPLGTARTFNFGVVQGVSLSTGTSEPCAEGCGFVSSKAISYDANGNVKSQTDFNGNRVDFTFDLVRNLENKRVEGLTAAGAVTADTRTISTEWHATRPLPTRIAGPQRLKTMTYDASGNLLTLKEQATTDLNGAAGFSAALVSGSDRLWTYTYDSVGHLLTIDGPRSDVSDKTSYTYFTDSTVDHKVGDLASVTNAAGLKTTFDKYDAHGRVTRTTDENSVVSAFTYDLRGRLQSVRRGSAAVVDAGAGESTAYAYDASGLLTKVTAPDGSYVNYAYDNAHRLTKVSDAVGNSISYSLDGMGNRTKEESKDSSGVLARNVARTFDTLSRVKTTTGLIQ